MNRLRGRVLAARGARYRVDTAEGPFECVLRGILKKEKASTVDPVAVGDEVEISVGPGGQGVVEAVEPRKTKFSRAAPGRTHLEQVIVANAAQLVITQAAREPALKVTSIDRYLVAAGAGGVSPLLCINKLDLDRRDRVPPVASLYRGLGIPVFLTVAITGEGVDDLKEALLGNVSVLVGPSGVGKTTLLNYIEPGLGLKVQSVSRKWAKGKHTTSGVELFQLEAGGWVADTPGLRELGIWGVGEQELGGYFAEFEPFAEECRFSTCTHSHEPGCGVAAAVEKGGISEDRYRSYLRILESLVSGD